MFDNSKDLQFTIQSVSSFGISNIFSIFSHFSHFLLYFARNKLFFYNLQFRTRFSVNISQQVTANRGGWWWRVWQFCVNWRQQRVSAWCFTFLKQGEDDTVFMRTRTNSWVRLSSKMISILDIFVWNKFSYKNLIFRPKSSGAEKDIPAIANSCREWLSRKYSNFCPNRPTADTSRVVRVLFWSM